jgi:hypothetical protein
VRSPRPLWRWWLFCGALRLWWRTGWRWLSAVYEWAPLPGWFGAWQSNTKAADDGPPF